MSADRKTAARDEIARLAAGVDYYRNWRIAVHQMIHGPGTEPDPKTLVEPGQVHLDLFDRSGGSHATFIKNELRDWYAMTAKEFDDFARTGGPEVAASLAELMADFRETLGFDFYSEAGVYDATIKKVTARGHIDNLREWSIIQDILTSAPDSTLTPEERQFLQAQMAAFEATQ